MRNPTWYVVYVLDQHEHKIRKAQKSIIPDMYEVVSELIFWVPDECDVGSTPCYAPNLGPQGLHELLILKGPRSEFPRLKISLI
jgi:hypothetical protein